MATETAAVAVAQTGETQNNTEVALTATPDTEAYNTVIEMLKSRELALSVTQLGCWKVWLARCWIATQHWRRSALLNCSTILSCHALQWTHCICAALLGSLRLQSATPLDLDCWSLRRLAMNPLMMCGLAYSHPTRCSRVWVLPTPPTQRQNCDCTRSHCNGWLPNDCFLICKPFTTGWQKGLQSIEIRMKLT